MSDETPPQAKFSVPTPVNMPATNSFPDPDRFLLMAKELVRDNYNAHHDIEATPPLEIDDIYIVLFSKVLTSWRAFLSATVVRGLSWMVTYNGQKNEAYIEIYKKINNVKVVLRERYRD